MLLSLLVVISVPATAQWIPTRAFGVRDGLAQSQVTSLVTDSFGYLWVGTQGGLSRFNGTRFDTFTTADGLPDDLVTALAAGEDGDVWVGTDTGRVARWDGRAFQSVASPGGSVTGLAVTEESQLLIATEAGLWRTSIRGDAVRLLEEPVRAVSTGPDGRVWAVADALYETDGAGVRRRAACPDGRPPRAFASGAEKLWLACGRGRLVTVDHPGTATETLDVGREILTLLLSRSGTVWVGAEDGLWKLDSRGTPHRQPLLASDPEWEIRTLHEDREENLWVSPWSGGLFRINQVGFAVLDLSSGFPTSAVWSFLEGEDGCMWVATEDVGVLEWCPSGVDTWLRPGVDLPEGRVMSLAPDGAGGLWIGTADGIVHRRTDGRSSFYTVADGLPDTYTRALLREDGGAVWAATSGGLARFRDGAWTSWTRSDGLSGDNLRALALRPSGGVWVGTHGGGVVGFDGADFTHLDDGAGAAQRRIWCLMTDSRNRLWTGTDGGIRVVPLDGSPVVTISTEEGLPSPHILFLVEDGEGDVWAGTTRGVARISPIGKVLRTFTAFDGLSDTEAAENAAVLDSHGRLWLGMAIGITLIDPANLPRNVTPPPLALERIIVNGRPWPGPFPLAALDGPPAPMVRLGPEVDDVRFEFSALSFTSPEKVRYRFMLDGWDSKLSSVTDESHTTYRHLAPGDYRFRLSGSNNDGVWTATFLEVPVRRLPAWYQTTWFRGAAGLLTVTIVFGWVGAHTAAQRRRQRELEREVARRTAELEEANDRLEELSRTDPLTRLPNRRVLAEQTPLEIAVIQREVSRLGGSVGVGYHGAALLMIDLDHFKSINDRWGHETGDVVLRAVADALRQMLRDVDLVVRWGGEEFVILARGVDRATVSVLARRVLERIAATTAETAGGDTVTITASIGYVRYPLASDHPIPPHRWSQLLDIADRLMYLAKQRGRRRAIGLAWHGESPVLLGETEILRSIQNDPTRPIAGLEVEEIVLDEDLTRSCSAPE